MDNVQLAAHAAHKKWILACLPWHAVEYAWHKRRLSIMLPVLVAEERNGELQPKLDCVTNFLHNEVELSSYLDSWLAWRTEFVFEKLLAS